MSKLLVMQHGSLISEQQGEKGEEHQSRRAQSPGSSMIPDTRELQTTQNVLLFLGRA